MSPTSCVVEAFGLRWLPRVLSQLVEKRPPSPSARSKRSLKDAPWTRPSVSTLRIMHSAPVPWPRRLPSLPSRSGRTACMCVCTFASLSAQSPCWHVRLLLSEFDAVMHLQAALKFPAFRGCLVVKVCSCPQASLLPTKWRLVAKLLEKKEHASGEVRAAFVRPIG